MNQCSKCDSMYGHSLADGTFLCQVCGCITEGEVKVE